MICWNTKQSAIALRYYASTKLCLACYHKAETLLLLKREWSCRVCQKVHDRDINAAMNLLNLSIESSLGIDTCKDTSIREVLRYSSYVSLKQEVTDRYLPISYRTVTILACQKFI
ncbi:MAG: zinc ribbon domain-containing protein [Candidatus Rhabdochlamydia sp.]